MRLSLESASRWLDLPLGVRVRVRPLTTAVDQAALSESNQRLQTLAREAEDAAKAGQPLDPLGATAANAAWLAGQQSQAMVEALARYGIEAWEGLDGDDGQPLPLTGPALAAFAAHQVIGPAFFSAYRAPVTGLAAEGNGSGSTAAGGGAAEPSTAAAATADPHGPTAETTETAPSAPAAPGN